MLFSKPRRILVVDDVADNLLLLQTVLEVEGYEIETALNGCLALAMIEDSPPDLLLLDVMMPDMSGYELTESIRQNDKLPFIPILLITAYDEVNVAEGLIKGANGFIRKPIDFDLLLTKISEILS
ncbi:sensor protein [Scytonema sp. HK-05]|uniref:response regulator n=1 Tax=Scytonema sp. HK-05 TaxID=1137095 RepID=UPI000937B401|nr:response regulator [Scytonema sp. HK-05]OKH61063.1 response regulator [Scytonema sp. HK-05]BAY46462.1 sensor protein [Scytonema sp. HK-05]